MSVTTEPANVTFLWLEITGRCQLQCGHCYNASGPAGTHGAMTAADWKDLISEAAATGVEMVQFIGGEPTLHPDLPDLIRHAVTAGLRVEVFTNLVKVTPVQWEVFGLPGVSLATSYYSDDPAQHNAITGRGSHRLTRSNIEKALRLGINLRVGIVAVSDTQRVEQARQELQAMGVSRIGVDHVRAFGRAVNGGEPDPSGLCGRCGVGKAAIHPDGRVSPCVFSTWMDVGNVRDQALVDILAGTAMADANQIIRQAPRSLGACEPDEECRPGFPGSGCNPRH